MRFRGNLADLVAKIAPYIYKKYITIDAKENEVYTYG